MLSLFYRNTRLLVLSICLILVWGISSFQILPRMEDPELSQPAALITTRFPGASAYRVESLVTEKIERELFEIPELKTIQSTSRLGVSTIQVKIKDEIPARDKGEVWSLVRDKIADVSSQLPSEVGEPQYQERETRASTMIVALTWNLQSSVNYSILARWGRELETELRTLSGTDKVDLFGFPDEEITVAINPANLTALGITTRELSQQIRLSDAKVASGKLHGRNNLLIETQTELDSLERIRNIPLASHNNSGQFARLGDVALVSKGIKEPAADVSLIDGKPAVVLGVFIESDRRIDRWKENASQTLTEFKQRLPQGVELQVTFDQSLYVSRRLDGLFKNLLLGAILVAGSTLILMGWKSALVVSSTLPLSVLMVFGGMRMLHIPLHQMSVTGLVIALGLLIDNAIVVVDEVQQKLKLGLKAERAISRSVSYLAVPLLASNATTVLTFMPIALLPGPVGESVKAIAQSVILALFSSLLLALTIVPALSGIVYQNRRQYFVTKEERKLHWWDEGLSIPQLTKLYRNSLKFALKRPLIGIILALILPFNGFVMASGLEEQFFPPAERDQLQIEFELNEGASLAETRLKVLQARQILLQHPEIVEVNWFLGKNAPKFYYNLLTNRQNAPNYAHGSITLASITHNERLIQSLQQELDRAFPSARVLLRELEQGLPLPAPIVFHLYGSDLEILRQLGDRVRAELSQLDRITHTRASLSEAIPKLGLEINEEQARLAGLNNTEIAERLNSNLEGSVGGSILESTEELPVRVRLLNSDRSNLDSIASLDLVPNNTTEIANPASVPLSAVGKFALLPEQASITRRNGKRVNTVEVFIDVDVLPAKVLTEFKQHLKTINFQMPLGYALEFDGESAERDRAIGYLVSTIGVLLILMIATLVLSFGSFRSAGIIALVGIGSIGLGLFSLKLFNYPLGFMSILGTIGLVGIAINDSIVVLAALHSHSQSRQGNKQAMENIIVHSTRHVLTTTVTTLTSFIPLLINGGEFWPPLSICIAGGVVGATGLALFFVPCAYLLLIRSRRKVAKFSKIVDSLQPR